MREGVLWKAIGTVLSGFVRRKQLKDIYSEILQLMTPVIERKYRPKIPNTIKKFKDVELRKEHSNYVWFCWLQGLENAPELVKKCYANLERYLVGKHLVIIDQATVEQYVTLPEIIVERWSRHQIPAALYSDVIRLELLIKYGGTWIDSTVLCTGMNFPPEYIDSDLFLFQFRRPTDASFQGISNWFINARPNHPMLMMVRDLLVEYWKEYDCVLSFFIFHIFFSLIVECEPSFVNQMPYGFSPNSLFLEHHLGDVYNQGNWEKLVSKVCFHKLTYRLDKSIINTPGNYYNKIVNGGIC